MSSSSKNLCWRSWISSRITSRIVRLRERVLTTLSIGRWGERTARRFLERRGIIALHTNWRSKHLEGDIIAIDNDQIVVVEVKTRRNYLRRFYPAIEAVGEEKLNKLHSLGLRWIRNNGPLCRRFSLRTFRIDAIEVYYHRPLGPLRITTEIRWHRGMSIRVR